MVPAAQTRKQQLGKLTGLAHSHAEGPAELPTSERQAPAPGRPEPRAPSPRAGARLRRPCGPAAGQGHGAGQAPATRRPLRLRELQSPRRPWVRPSSFLQTGKLRLHEARPRSRRSQGVAGPQPRLPERFGSGPEMSRSRETRSTVEALLPSLQTRLSCPAPGPRGAEAFGKLSRTPGREDASKGQLAHGRGPSPGQC